MARRTHWAAALGLVAANIMLANALLAQPMPAPRDATRVGPEAQPSCTWKCGNVGQYQGCPVSKSDISCGGSECNGSPGQCDAQ